MVNNLWNLKVKTGDPLCEKYLYHVRRVYHILRPLEGYITEFDCEQYVGTAGNTGVGSDSPEQIRKDEQKREEKRKREQEEQKQKEKSSVSEEKKNPKITNPRWNKQKAFISDKILMLADVTDIDNGRLVELHIMEKESGEVKFVKKAYIDNGKIECEWKYTKDVLERKEDEEGFDNITDNVFIFKVKWKEIESDNSGELKVLQKIQKKIFGKDRALLEEGKKAKVKFANGYKKRKTAKLIKRDNQQHERRKKRGVTGSTGKNQ